MKNLMHCGTWTMWTVHFPSTGPAPDELDKWANFEAKIVEPPTTLYVKYGAAREAARRHGAPAILMEASVEYDKSTRRITGVFDGDIFVLPVEKEQDGPGLVLATRLPWRLLRVDEIIGVANNGPRRTSCILRSHDGAPLRSFWHDPRTGAILGDEPILSGTAAKFPKDYFGLIDRVRCALIAAGWPSRVAHLVEVGGEICSVFDAELHWPGDATDWGPILIQDDDLSAEAADGADGGQ